MDGVNSHKYKKIVASKAEMTTLTNMVTHNCTLTGFVKLGISRKKA